MIIVSKLLLSTAQYVIPLRIEMRSPSLNVFLCRSFASRMRIFALRRLDMRWTWMIFLLGISTEMKRVSYSFYLDNLKFSLEFRFFLRCSIVGWNESTLKMCDVCILPNSNDIFILPFPLCPWRMIMFYLRRLDSLCLLPIWRNLVEWIVTVNRKS